MAKKKLDNIDLEMIQCEKDGYGVHYGWWKAKQPIYVPPAKEMRVCKFCGKLFEPQTIRQKYCDSVCSCAHNELRAIESAAKSYQKKKQKKAEAALVPSEG